MHKPFVTLALLLLTPTALDARRTDPKPAAAQVGTGMVSAADPRAAAAGVEILKAGGSATDAAIASAPGTVGLSHPYALSDRFPQ